MKNIGLILDEQMSMLQTKFYFVNIQSRAITLEIP